MIYDTKCECRAYIKGQSPSLPKEIKDILGPKLPLQYYFYMMLGLISPSLLNLIVNKKIIEVPPYHQNSDINDFLQSNIKESYETIMFLLQETLEHSYFEGKFIYELGYEVPEIEPGPNPKKKNMPINNILKPNASLRNIYIIYILFSNPLDDKDVRTEWRAGQTKYKRDKFRILYEMDFEREWEDREEQRISYAGPIRRLCNGDC